LPQEAENTLMCWCMERTSRLHVGVHAELGFVHCSILGGSWDPLHFLNKMEVSITMVLKQINDINAHILKLETLIEHLHTKTLVME
jgi:hypothetical protein